MLLPDCQRHTEGSRWRKWQSGHPSPPLLSLIIELVIWKSPQARPSVLVEGEGGLLLDSSPRRSNLQDAPKVNGNLILHGYRHIIRSAYNMLAALPREGNFVQVT